MPKGSGRPYQKPARASARKPLSRSTLADFINLAEEYNRSETRKAGESSRNNPFGSMYKPRTGRMLGTLKKK